MARVDADKLFGDFEKKGELTVRKELASGAVYGADKVGLAQEWLDQKAQERADAFNREQMEIARSAASAARDAADAARSANIRATIALIIAAVTAIVLITDLALSWYQSSGGAP